MPGPRGRNRNRIELNDIQKHDIKRAFDLFDKDGSGRIDAQVLTVTLRALGFEAKPDDIPKYLGPDSAEIDFNDFLEVLIAKMSEKETKDDAVAAFDMFNVTRSGTIGMEDLKAVATELGEGLSEEELLEMLRFGVNLSKESGLPVPSSQGAVPAAQLALTEEDFLRVMRKAGLY